MTATVGLYLKASYAEGPTARIIGYFFFSSLLYKGLRVLVRLTPDYRLGRRKKGVIILGSGRRASKAWHELRVRHYRTKWVVGFVDDRNPQSMPPDIAGRHLGSVDDLSALLRRNTVDELVIAASMRSEYDMMQRGITIGEQAGVRVLCLSDIFSLAHEPDAETSLGPFIELVPKSQQAFLARRLERARQMIGMS